ncbi:MAG: UDP-2,3-diacylglucosamine diphosphatase LpxI [Pseudomonadota bacterium]
MTAKLGIIAGRGPLPRTIAQFCIDSGRPFQVICMEGQAEASLFDGLDHMAFRLGAAGAMLKWLRDGGVEELVMAGAVRRPSLSELKPDWRAAKFFAKVGAKALGDDGLLSAVIAELEKEGFKLVAVDELLLNLSARAETYGDVTPDESAWSDIRHGIRIARGLGELDVGQGVVVQQGLILAAEAIEGTDEMIARAGTLQRDGAGGVLVKVKKPNQERRADLPTIGVGTVRQVAESGLRGIAIEAGSALVIDPDGVREIADERGVFVVGVEVDPDTGRPRKSTQTSPAR